MIHAYRTYTVGPEDRKAADEGMAQWRYWAACRKAERLGLPAPKKSDYIKPRPPVRRVVTQCDECGEEIMRSPSNIGLNKKKGYRTVCEDCRYGV